MLIEVKEREVMFIQSYFHHVSWKYIRFWVEETLQIS